MHRMQVPGIQILKRFLALRVEFECEKNAYFIYALQHYQSTFRDRI